MIRVGELSIPTLDDLSFLNKKILVRLDINSPIEPKSGKLLDDSRIKAHIPTLRELIEKGNALVLLSHQGRPGDSDFVGLEEHSKVLSRYLGQEVEFVEDVMGPYALNRIRELRSGEVIMLDNVRLVSEELIEAPPDQHARSFLVNRLSKVVNSFVNDAFATAHRSQPSLVGFPVVIPSSAGRLMEREVSALAKIFNSETSPKVFVLGGGKVQDSIRIIENLSKRRLADRILTGGLLAEVFMIAKGMNLGKENLQILERHGILSLVPRAKKVLLAGAPVEVPVDFRVESQGNVIEESSTRISGIIKDVGPTTEEIYSSFIRDAGLTVLRGPMGVIEDERFRRGSSSLLRAALESKGYVIVGGGHMISVIGEAQLDPAKVHVSTGGGALLLFLAGESLPALEALSRGVKA
ncbi:phosphoglycerate kinase [Sulfodiicoccus acidiphilus]|uniref:Phosphoglycerate kinase n=1 Tax=Sulfodiicoccus acidiphilus TaxID=1670455 RepID=A0A348B355_9CREN|nr:phosphoglycerate kinase [Sulfodiicoccus acidiphilus]BBD72607.1 phosphoglycerate kinase [Sulfodiicoccus acidiphilus]GGT93368.1 phosphoglycerate kinase [Sulfodiicoccus acidiphilus]